MRYTMRPISDRTAFTGKYKPSPFTASWSDTLDLLERELTALQGKEVVLELDVTESQIRMDGMVRADAKISSPAVRIAFESRYGPLTYATDAFISPSYRRTMTDWQQNVRAIALALEALRRVDRYGVTRRGEQYTGWKAIGSGTATAMPAGMSRADAEAVITNIVGPVDRPWDSRFRMARAEAHPDRNGGDRALWDQVEQAGKTLGLVS